MKWNQSFTYGSNGFGNVNWTGTGLGTTRTPVYDNANHFQGTGISYDSNGNLLTDTTHTYTWDADGKLYQMDSTIMTYDALGRRVEQAVGTTYTEIVYGPGGGKLALVNGTNGAGQAVISAFIPLPAGATAVYAGNTLSRYRHSDWLGSSRLSSIPTQPTSVLYDGAYSPMGESYSESGTKDRNFTGQNQDLTTDPLGDLYDFMYREYHPIHGRWISPDPAGLAAVSPANPQSWNRYAYVNGSPLNSVDPLGLCDGGNLTSGINCGFASAMGWLIGSGGWDPAGMSIAPYGGLGTSGSMGGISPMVAGLGRYTSILGSTYDLLAQQNGHQATSTTITYWSIPGGLLLGSESLQTEGTWTTLFKSSGVDDAISRPWVVSWIVPLVDGVPVLAGIGPAGDFEWNPATKTACIGLGIGAAAGHNLAYGQLAVGQMFNGKNYPEGADDILRGVSLSGGYNWPNLLGVQGMINDSGWAGGGTVGLPGGSIAVTNSACLTF